LAERPAGATASLSGDDTGNKERQALPPDSPQAGFAAAFGTVQRPVSSGPTNAADRIHTLDVLRGVAICGILLMNIWTMGGVAEHPLLRFPAGWTSEWISWAVQTILVQGAMRGLFTLLFGAGMVLMLRRAEGPDGKATSLDIWARRCLALMAFGTAQWALFLWPGEILWNYGVTGLFLLAFRTARPRTLLIAAGLLIAGLSANNAYWTHEEVVQLQQGSTLLAHGTGAPLSDDEAAAVRAERQARGNIHPTAATHRAEIERRTHWGSLIRWSGRYWATENLSVTGWLDVAESLSFMLVGMALFRLGVLTGAASDATYRRLMLWGYGAGLAWRALPVVLGVRSGLDMGSPLVTPFWWTLNEASFEPARLLITLGHAGLIVTLLRAGWLGRAVTLRALGRMTLTVYCLQSILGSTLFYAAGLVGRLTLLELWLIAAGIWTITALFCRWWLARVDMGPGEQLLRAIAYGTLPAGRRRGPAPAQPAGL
jgi:uncharacterized protein